MISKYLGEDTFIDGVRRYIKKHAWGNTQTSDLWDALGEASGKDVAHVMDIWTKNIGYPVISVTENETDSSITVKQNRFLRTRGQMADPTPLAPERHDRSGYLSCDIGSQATAAC